MRSRRRGKKRRSRRRRRATPVWEWTLKALAPTRLVLVSNHSWLGCRPSLNHSLLTSTHAHTVFIYSIIVFIALIIMKIKVMKVVYRFT